LKTTLRGDIDRFQGLLAFLKRFNVLNSKPSMLLASTNPFNYVSMGQMLDAWGISAPFRVKILKPLFVNFVLATNVFDMAASMFSRYLDFFDIEKATPMVTWAGGTRRIYECLSRDFKDRIRLNTAVTRIERDGSGVTVETRAAIEALRRSSSPATRIRRSCSRGAELGRAPRPRAGTLRERASQPRHRPHRRLGAAGRRHEGDGDAQQLCPSLRRAARQLRTHLRDAQPAAVGEALGQAVPLHLQPDPEDRREQDREALVVPACRARCFRTVVL
jgi:hypothetical protein